MAVVLFSFTCVEYRGGELKTPPEVFLHDNAGRSLESFKGGELGDLVEFVGLKALDVEAAAASEEGDHEGATLKGETCRLLASFLFGEGEELQDE